MTEGQLDEGIEHFETSPRFSPAEKIALRYALWMAVNPQAIDAAFYDALRDCYSEGEIVELGAYIGFNIGFHTFFGTLKFYPMFAPDGRLVSQEESAQIYGATPVSLAYRSPAGGRSTLAQSGPEPAEELSGGPRESGLDSRPALKRAEQPAGQQGDGEWAALAAQAELVGVPDRRFCDILARNPPHAQALLRAMLLSHTEGSVDHRLKEMIRIKLARTAGDPYFSALRSHRALQSGLDEETIRAACAGEGDSDPRFTPEQRIALRYADRMYGSPGEVDERFYRELKAHYSEAQIMELGSFIAFHYGMQAFMRTLQ